MWCTLCRCASCKRSAMQYSTTKHIQICRPNTLHYLWILPLDGPEILTTQPLGGPETLTTLPLGGPETLTTLPLGGPETLTTLPLGGQETLTTLPLGGPETLTTLPLGGPTPTLKKCLRTATYRKSKRKPRRIFNHIQPKLRCIRWWTEAKADSNMQPVDPLP